MLKLANSYLIDSAQPSNLNYTWNFGSLLAVCLGIQIVTGVTLAMHYSTKSLVINKQVKKQKVLQQITQNTFISWDESI